MEEYKELITAYIAGELGKEECENIEKLLAGDTGFKDEFDKLRKTWELYGTLEAAHVPDEIKSRIMEEIERTKAAIPVVPEPVNPPNPKAAIPVVPEPVNPPNPKAAIPVVPEPVNPPNPKAAIPVVPEPVNPPSPRASKKISITRFMAPLSIAAAILMLLTMIPVLNTMRASKPATEMASLGVEEVEDSHSRLLKMQDSPESLSLPPGEPVAKPTSPGDAPESKARITRRAQTEAEMYNQIRGYLNKITPDEEVVKQAMKTIEENVKKSPDPRKELARLSGEMLPKEYAENVDPTTEMASRYEWFKRRQDQNSGAVHDGMTTSDKKKDSEHEDNGEGNVNPSPQADMDPGNSEKGEQRELNELTKQVDHLRRKTERENSWASNAMGRSSDEKDIKPNLSQGSSTRSNEWVFILDLSKAMAEKLTPSQLDSLPAHLKDKCDNRLDLAKYELKTALDKLAEKMSFGVILMTDSGASFVDSQGRIRIYVASEFRTMPATKENITNVTNKVMSLKPGLTTDKQQNEMISVLQGLDGRNALAITSLELHTKDGTETRKRGKVSTTWLLDLSGSEANRKTATTFGINYSNK